MALNQVKRVEFDAVSNSFVADDGAGPRVELHAAKTDFGVGESVDDFVIRHGGVTKTIDYLKSIGHAEAV